MLQSLHLQNFRNHENESFSFSPSLTIITGENGKGKTNILEAISALAFIKPFRSNKKEVFVQHKKEFSKITAQCSNEEISIYWGISMGDKLQIKRDDIIVNSKEFLQEKNFLAVLFSPEDLNLPFLSPQYRRQFLSRFLSSLFPDYFSAALRYKSVMQQRNILLKKYNEGSVHKNEFAFWNRELANNNEIIMKHHKDFFDFANQFLEKEYEAIAQKKEWVEITPLFSFDIHSDFLEQLEKNFEKDLWRGSTSIGVHRDDFTLHLRNNPVEESASRGETRSVLLALKRVEQLFIEHHSGRKPILLLDDVFSELDHNHQKHLLMSMTKCQCIITTTEVEIEIPEEREVKYIKL